MSKTARSHRWTGWLNRKPSILRPFPSLRFEELEVRDNPAATFIWTGAVDSFWAKGGNWQGGTAPTGSVANGGEDLVFGAAATQFTSTNDLTGTPTFNSILFQTGGFTLNGAAINLGLSVAGSGTINVSDGALGNAIAFDTTLTAPGGTNVQTITVGTGAALTIGGRLAGTTGATLTKDGSGTLTLSNDNSLFTGRIKINDNAGVVQITDAKALGNTAADTTVGTNASLRITAAVGTINEPLRLNGPGLINDGALRQNAAGTVTWAGPIILDSNSFIGAQAGSVLDITGIVSDTGTGRDLTKEGQGEVRLNNATGNTYRGLTTVNDGVLTAGTATALGTKANGGAGTVASGTIVKQTLTKVGQLRLAALNGTGFTILDEFLTLNGGGPGGAVTPGALANGVGDNLWAGPVTLGSPAPDGVGVTIGAAAGTNLTISGVVSSPNGAFALTKTAPGRLILNNANTYTGATTVAQGFLNVRDSRALGSVAAGTSVSTGATLELDVESAYPTQPQTDTQGTPAVTRDLGNDSVTNDPNKLLFTEPLTIAGRGVGGAGANTGPGALHSVSGINRWDVSITLATPLNGTLQDAIGVGLDFRPGHPLPTSAYFTQDYSLTITKAIVDPVTIPPNVVPSGNPNTLDGRGGDNRGDFEEFIKRGAGHLILPVANTYTGWTRIEQGWVTIGNTNSLGAGYPARSTTYQPGTVVSAGAALHVEPLNADGTRNVGGTLTIPENITLQGIGPTHPYKFISQKGALVNLDGRNTWTGTIGLFGQAGIGVEGLFPAPASDSELTVTGSLTEGQQFYTYADDAAGGTETFVIDTLGATSGLLHVNYVFWELPDTLSVNYPAVGQPGSTQIFTTGSVFDSRSVDVPFGPGAAGSNISVSVTEGGGGSIWDLREVSFTAPGGLIKFGDRRLTLTADGSYSLDNEVREGTLRVQHDSALGQKSSGTYTTQQVYTQTNTTVSTGAVMELVRGTAANNSGITAGLNVSNERLILNSPGQQIGVTGSGGTFTLSLTRPDPSASNVTATSAPVPITVPASGGGPLPTDSLQNTINALMSEFRTVTVGGLPTDTFRITFRGQMTNPIPVGAAASTVETELNNLSTIGGAGGGVVVTSAPSGTDTVYTINFAVGTLATVDIPAADLTAAPAAGTPTVATATLLDGLGFAAVVTLSGSVYTVVFGNAQSADIPNLLVATPVGGAEVTVSGGNAPLTSLNDDHAWHGPVTLASFTRIATTPNTRISLLGNIDDAPAAAGSDLTKRGTGELLVGGTNTYRGFTLIDQGIMTAASSTAFGSPAGGTEVSNGAQMQIQGSLTIAGEALTVQGSGSSAANLPSFPNRWANDGPATTDNGYAPKNLPTSARITGIATDPRDTDVIYVSTAGGGGWKTKDGGLTWLPLFDDQSGIDPKAVMYGAQVLISRAAANVIYFATGNADGFNNGPIDPVNGSVTFGQPDNYAGTGVYRSTNFGVTWTLMTGLLPGAGQTGPANPIFGQAVTKMIQGFDPIAGTEEIFVATSNENLVNGSPTAFAGVYRFNISPAGALQGWYNLTGTTSFMRTNTAGAAPYDPPPVVPAPPPATGNGPPLTPGPDDDYRMAYPRNKVTLPTVNPYDNPVVSGLTRTVTAGTPAPATWSDILLLNGQLFAAMSNDNQQWFNGFFGEANQAYVNSVYRNTFPSTTQAVPTGTIADLSLFANPALPFWLEGQDPNGTFTPDNRPSNFFLNAPYSTPNGIPTSGVPLGDGVALASVPIQPVTPGWPHNQIPQPGRNGYIKLTGDLDLVTYAPAAVPVVYATVTYPNWHYLRGQLQDIQIYTGPPTAPPTWAGVNPTFFDATGNVVQPFGAAQFNPGADFTVRQWNTIPGLGRYDNAILIEPTTDRLTDRQANTAFIGGLTGLFKTTNRGLTWTALNTPNANPTGNGPANQYRFLSIDRNDRVLAGTDGGIWRLDGTNYTDLNGNLQITQFNSVDPHPTSLFKAVAGSADNGTQVYNNNLAWTRTDDTVGTNSGVVRYDPKNPNVIWAARDGQLRRTTNGGTTWALVRDVSNVAGGASAGLRAFLDQPPADPSTPPGAYGNDPRIGPSLGYTAVNYFPLIVDAQDENRLLIGGPTGLFETVNALAGTGLPNAPPGTPTFIGLNAPIVPTIIAAATFQGPFVLDPGFLTVTDKLSNTYNPETIYISSGVGVAVTKNRGVSWQVRTPTALQGFVNTVATPATITDLAVDPANRDIVYLTVSQGEGVTTSGRIFRSTNAGLTWTNITGSVATGLPQIGTYRVIVDPRSGTLYVGNDNGVWALPNAATTGTFVWARFGAGMPRVQVHDLVLNTTLNTITAGTYGRGMYQLLLTDYVADSGVVREVSGSSTWTGPVTLKGASVLGASGSQNIQNGITAASLNFVGPITDLTPPGGPFTVTKRGLGTVIFSGVNTYSGQTVVEEGVLLVNNPHALGGDSTIPGDTGLNTVVNTGAVLGLRTDLDSEPVTINGDGILFNGHFGGSLRNVSNDNTYTGTLTLGTARTTIGTDSGSSLTIGSKAGLTGTGRIVEGGANFAWDKELTGTLALASANTFGGLVLVRQGALQVQHGAALGSNTGATEVLDGAAVEIARNAYAQSLGLPALTVVPTEPLFLSGTGIFGTGALRNVRGIRDQGIDQDPAIGEPANGYLRHGVGDDDPNGTNDNTWAGPITLAVDPNTFPQTNPSTLVSFGVSDRRDSLTIDTTITQQPTPAIVPGQPATIPAQGGTAPASMGLTKVGAGRLILNKPNVGTDAFTGVVNVADGSLRVRDKDALGGPVSSAVQQINIVGTGGTFQLRFNGITSAATITLTAGPPATTLAGLITAVQTALNGMSTVGAGNTLVSGTQSTNGFILTVTFQGALANTDLPLILPVNSVGVNVFITTVQQGGTGTTVAGGANLEFDGAAGGLVVPELLTLNGDGLPSGVTVTSVPVPGGGDLYTISFVGSLENVNHDPLVAIGTNGAIPTVATLQDGTPTLSEVQTVTVVGGAGEFTLTFNGRTTTPLPYGSSADAVQAQLDLLTSVGGFGRSGALRQYTGDNTTTGLVTLGSDTSVGAAANTTLTLAAGFQDPTPVPISLVTPVPAARFRKAGPGTVVLPTANAYNGRTVVDDGVLRATNPLAVGVGRTELQTLSSFVAGNNYTLTFNGSTTGTLAGGASAAAVQAALLALPTVRHPEVQALDVTGSAGGSFTLTYKGVPTASIPASPTAAVPALIQSEVTTILGAGPGSVVSVVPSAITGGTRYTITFGGPVNFMDLVQLIPFGTNGAVVAMATAQDGLNGSVTVTSLPAAVGSVARYQIAFGEGAPVAGFTSVGLTNVNVPQLGVTMVPATAVPSVFVATAQDGQGAEVQTLSENAIVGNFLLTFNGQSTPFSLPFNASDNAVRTALNALSSLGVAEVQRVQVLGASGTFDLSFDGSAPVTLPVGASALAVQAALNGLRTVNGGGGGGGVGGVGGSVTVTSTNVPDGIVYTVTFGGTLDAADQPTIVATTASPGVTTTVATEQDGGGVYVTRATVAGGFVYTVMFTGGGMNNANQPQVVATGSGGSFFTNLTSNEGPEGTSVSSGATLQLGTTAVSTEVATLNGSGFNGLGALDGTGASVWSGPVFLGSNASVGTAAAGDTLLFTGPITDGIPGNPNPFGVDVLGPGTVTYGGAVDNRYFGTTHVIGGTLLLSQSVAGVPSGLALRGPLVVGGGPTAATATETLNDQIEDVLPVSVLPNGTFNLSAGLKDVIDTLSVDTGTVNVAANGKLTTTGVTMLAGTINVGAAAQVVLNGNVTATSLLSGNAQILGPGVLALNGADRTLTVSEGPQAVDLLVTAGLTGVAAVPEHLVKDGLGRVEFAPTVAQTVPVDVRQGDLQIDPTAPLGPTQLLGGTISGTGTVASLGQAGLPAAGTVAPGVNWQTAPAGPFGILHSSGPVVLGPLTTLFLNLQNTNGPGQPVVGTDFDQLQVTGPITLGGAVLTGTLGAGVKVGDQFTIITATGGVSGRLAQPNGPNVVFLGGRKFSVDYSTNPNQVTLTNVLAAAGIGLVSSANPSTIGQSVTFTATVTPEPGAAAIPAGSTVTFTINGVPQAPVTLDINNRAAITRTFPTGGSYTITATFNGDPAGQVFAPSTTSLIQGVGVPVIDALQASSLFISPTPASIGTQDTITLSTTVRGDSSTVNWKIEVFAGPTATGTAVRTFTGSGSGDPFPIGAVWDGRNAGGSVVADGQYTVKASFTDGSGNSGSTTLGVFVDSTVPTATGLTTATPVIAPGTASTVPTTTILNTTIGDANPDRYTVTIRDSLGNVVRTIIGSFTPGPAQSVDIAWDGRNNANAIVPDGTYTASLTVKDLAGNTTTPAATTTIVVLTTAPTVTLVSSSPTIYGQDATFTATVTTSAGSIANQLQGVVVQFVRGATVLGEAPLQFTSGAFRATLTVSSLMANAAGYSVKAVFPGNGTFLPAQSSTITHQVLPATLSVTIDSLSKTYGDANPPLSFTVGGLVNGDTQASVITGSPMTTVTTSTSVGTYTIDQGTITLISPNYTLNLVQGTLTVTPAALTVRADDQTRVYGDANPPLTLTVSGLVNGDTQAAVLTGVPTTTATTTSGVGLYTISKGSVAANGNYTLTFFNGTLRVTPAPLTVTPDNLTKVYGAAVPPRTFTVSGLKNGDTTSVLAGSLSTTATAASNVGTYPITRGSLAVTNNNYALTVLTGAVVTVTPASLSVKADNQTKVYGSAVPTLTVSATGLVNGDTTATALTGSPRAAATAGSGVGTYSIDVGTLAAANGNYALSFSPGTLSVTPAPLTVTADNKARRVNTANPPLTASFAGLVNGDTAAVVSNLNLTTTAATASPVGNYPITSSTAPAAANYDVTFVPGTLSVTTDGISPPPPPPPPPPPGTSTNFTVSGAPNGSGRQFNPATLQPVGGSVNPFPGFGGDVRGATGDFNGDGFVDSVFVTGPGTKTVMSVISGKDGSTLLGATDPFGDANFTFGGFVTAGDIDRDGRAEWVVTPELRGGPRVVIFRLLPDGTFDITSPGQPSLVANFFGIGDPAFRDGDRAALGDVNGDGILDVFSIAAFNGGPRTALYNGADVLTARNAGRDPVKLTGDFFAAPSGQDEGRGGRSIAVGDINGDGRADLIVTGDNLLGTGNQVTIFSGADLAAGRVPGFGATPLASFTVGGQSGSSLVSVAAVNADGDGKSDLAVGSGPGQFSLVKVYNGTKLTGATAEPDSTQFDPFGGLTLNGVFVG